jgi:hypothetical protein
LTGKCKKRKWHVIKELHAKYEKQINETSQTKRKNIFFLLFRFPTLSKQPSRTMKTSRKKKTDNEEWLSQVKFTKK